MKEIMNKVKSYRRVGLLGSLDEMGMKNLV